MITMTKSPYQLQAEPAIFEAMHGTASDFVDKNKLNLSSMLLSAYMLLAYTDWDEGHKLLQML